ncbi:hypothetical protein AB1E33_21625 [Ruegeria sp. 2012CJ15-1]|uniref:hypothetical protein n=1 Tax=Ruegeria hyattellae TaxID=3233337 RepID=UPI00355C80BD
MNLIVAPGNFFSLTAYFNLATLIILASFITISLFGMTRLSSDARRAFHPE